MSHLVESAATGRAKCRGCDQKIDKGELRFGERRPNLFGDGEMTLWFHLDCAAFKRPEAFIEALDAGVADACDDSAGSRVAAFRPIAEHGIAHRRLPRVDGASLAPTGRAKCRCCREPIDKNSWRISLVFFEEYRFQPSGFVHAGCASEYFGTTEILDRVRYFEPDLSDTEIDELRSALQ